jgi:hypothetical protein
MAEGFWPFPAESLKWRGFLSAALRQGRGGAKTGSRLKAGLHTHLPALVRSKMDFGGTGLRVCNGLRGETVRWFGIGSGLIRF